MFDYQSKNYEIYGTQMPPAYNLSTVDMPIVVMGATNDYLVAPPVRCLSSYKYNNYFCIYI